MAAAGAEFRCRARSRHRAPAPPGRARRLAAVLGALVSARTWLAVIHLLAGFFLGHRRLPSW